MFSKRNISAGKMGEFLPSGTFYRDLEAQKCGTERGSKFRGYSHDSGR